jgi:exopolysaccharide biosynthesis protein
VTIDGRQPQHSVGINLNELAELLLELGATDAMNLDGGGSTTMFVNGKVVNKPSDKEGERNVSDAILVFPRKR